MPTCSTPSLFLRPLPTEPLHSLCTFFPRKKQKNEREGGAPRTKCQCSPEVLGLGTLDTHSWDYSKLPKAPWLQRTEPSEDRGEGHRLWSHQAWVRIPALLFTSPISMGKVLTPPPQFPPPCNEEDSGCIGKSCCLQQWLAGRKFSINISKASSSAQWGCAPNDPTGPRRDNCTKGSVKFS